MTHSGSPAAHDPRTQRSAEQGQGRTGSVPAAVWAAAGLALALRLVLSLSTGFTAEDFLISLRHAENLAAGHGLVYNPGERSLGATSPLYVLLLGLLSWMGLPASALGKAVNTAADAVLCLAVYRWMRAAGHERAGRVAAFLVAVHPWHARWAVSGMETSLATLGGLAALEAFAAGRTGRAAALLGLLFLVRWDSLLLAGTLAGAHLLRVRRPPVREAALYAAIVAPWTLFSLWVYGTPVPTTGNAKMTVYGWRFQGQWLPQLDDLAVRFLGTPGAALLTTLAVVGAARLARQGVGALGPGLAWMGIYWTAFLLSRNLLFEWYLVPTLPVVEAAAAVGMTGLAERLRVSRSIAWTAAGLAAAGLALVSIRTCTEAQSIEENLRKPIGLWLRAHSRPGDRVMLEPVGYIGYYSRLRVVDVVGLVTPQVLPYWRRGSPAPFLDIARAFRPEWCVLRPGELKRMVEAARSSSRPWEREYVLARTFAYTPRPDREPIIFHVFRRIGDPRESTSVRPRGPGPARNRTQGPRAAGSDAG